MHGIGALGNSGSWRSGARLTLRLRSGGQYFSRRFASGWWSETAATAPGRPKRATSLGRRRALFTLTVRTQRYAPNLKLSVPQPH